MTKSHKLLTGVTLVAISVGGIAACGHHRYTDPVKKMEYIVEKVDDKLELNDNQRVELEKLKNQLLTLMVEVKQRKETTHKQIDEMLTQSNLDQKKLLNIIQEQTRHVNESAPELVVAMAGFYDALTPEQQATLRDQFATHHLHR